jgi:hypothetical protein
LDHEVHVCLKNFFLFILILFHFCDLHLTFTLRESWHILVSNPFCPSVLLWNGMKIFDLRSQDRSWRLTRERRPDIRSPGGQIFEKNCAWRTRLIHAIEFEAVTALERNHSLGLCMWSENGASYRLGKRSVTLDLHPFPS